MKGLNLETSQISYWDSVSTDWEYHCFAGHTGHGYFDGIPFREIQRAFNTEFIIKPTDRVLDIPSGANPYDYLLNVNPWQITAADISIEMLRRNTSPNQILLDMNDSVWTLPSNAFNYVTSFFGLRYTLNSENFIANSARVLKPGGQIIFIDFETKSQRIPNTIELRCLDFNEVATKAMEWFENIQVRTLKNSHAPVKMISATKIN